MHIIGKRDNDLLGCDEFHIDIQLPKSEEELQNYFGGFFINKNLQPYMPKLFSPGKEIRYHALILDFFNDSHYPVDQKRYLSKLKRYSLREATFNELLAFVLTYYGYAKEIPIATTGIIPLGQTLRSYMESSTGLSIAAEHTVMDFAQILPGERGGLGCTNSQKFQFKAICGYRNNLNWDIKLTTRFLTVKL